MTDGPLDGGDRRFSGVSKVIEVMSKQRILLLLRASVLLVTGAETLAGAVVAVPAPERLQVISLAERKEAGIGGTNCLWTLPREDGVRFAMSEDHALAKLGGVPVVFVPAPGAVDMFPFTFDRWQSADLIIAVVDVGAGRRSGSEVMKMQATLIIDRRGVRRRVRGMMACGN